MAKSSSTLKRRLHSFESGDCEIEYEEGESARSTYRRRVSAEDYRKKNVDLLSRMAEAESRLEISTSDELDLESFIEYLRHSLWNTSTAWQSSDLSTRKSIQSRMFPLGLTWGNGGFGAPVTHCLYPLLADDSVPETDLVAPQGFEPRLIGSEPTVLPLNERAIQVKDWQLQARAGATISRLFECTGVAQMGQPARNSPHHWGLSGRLHRQDILADAQQYLSSFVGRAAEHHRCPSRVRERKDRTHSCSDLARLIHLSK